MLGNNHCRIAALLNKEKRDLVQVMDIFIILARSPCFYPVVENDKSIELYNDLIIIYLKISA